MIEKEVYPLSNEQLPIVNAPASLPQLVVAPPGTGKTHIVVGRILHLIQDERINPSELLVLCFTRIAVAEITRRLKDLVRDNHMHDDLRFVSVSTFDSFATRLLLSAGTDDFSGFSYNARIDLAVESLEEENSDASNIISGFRHLIVDEIQDLVGVRAKLVQLLLRRISGSFTLLGDPAQAIYGFSNEEGGSDFNSDTLLEWVKQQTWSQDIRECTLNENFRSQGNIAEKALSLRKNILAKKEDDTRALEQLRKFVNDLHKSGTGKKPELPAISSDETLCVLCRTNGEVLQMASLFALNDVNFVLKPRPEDNGLPAWIGRVLGGYSSSRISKHEFEDIWKDLINNAISVNAEQGWNWLKRIEERESRDLDIHVLHSQFRRGKGLPDDSDAFLRSNQNGLSISTTHAVKGREFDKVVILQPDNMKPMKSDNSVEEARILYVAATRARREISSIGRTGLPMMWKMECNGDRSRWIARSPQKGYHFIEVGLQGDIEQYSSVNTYIYPNRESVRQTQDFLWKNINYNPTVTMQQVKAGRYAFFHLLSGPDNDKEKYKLGQISLNLKHDIRKALYNVSKGNLIPYPKHWDGIQVSAVVTEIIPTYPEHCHKPYDTSGFCLGVRIRGMGYLCQKG